MKNIVMMMDNFIKNMKGWLLAGEADETDDCGKPMDNQTARGLSDWEPYSVHYGRFKFVEKTTG